MSLQEFTSKIKNEGLARTNHYAVTIAPPRVNAAAKDLQLLCSAVTTPSTSSQVTEIQLPWKSFDNPIKNSFENITASFYMDSNMLLKAVFDQWMLTIYDNTTGVVGWRKDYVTDIEIMHMDLANRNIYSTTLINAFPVGIPGANYTSQTGAPLYELQVTFSYDYWTTKQVVVSASSKAAGPRSWWEEALGVGGEILGTYQGIKNTIGDVKGQIKSIDSLIKSGGKASSLDGWIKAGAGIGGNIQGASKALGNFGNFFRPNNE